MADQFRLFPFRRLFISPVDSSSPNFPPPLVRFISRSPCPSLKARISSAKCNPRNNANALKISECSRQSSVPIKHVTCVLTDAVLHNCRTCTSELAAVGWKERREREKRKGRRFVKINLSGRAWRFDNCFGCVRNAVAGRNREKRWIRCSTAIHRKMPQSSSSHRCSSYPNYLVASVSLV